MGIDRTLIIENYNVIGNDLNPRLVDTPGKTLVRYRKGYEHVSRYKNTSTKILTKTNFPAMDNLLTFGTKPTRSPARERLPAMAKFYTQQYDNKCYKNPSDERRHILTFTYINRAKT